MTLGVGESQAAVAVCALTFRRPEGLRRLLEGLADLEIPEEVDARIVVVDNDSSGSASSIVDEHRSTLPVPVAFVVEPRRGIPFAWNTAIATAGAVDFVAFIDDDEVPDRRWLAELVAVQRQTDADVVTGPVLAEFEVPPPAWIVRGRFFERKRRPTGTPMSWATTSSVLIATRILPADVPAFHEGMALTGGTDTHFFMRAQLEGRRMVWADDAIVTEVIPHTRVRLGWILRRQYRAGNTQTLCMLDLRPSTVRRVRRAGQGSLTILQGTALLVAAAVRGRAAAAHALGRICYGAGLLAGLVGLRYEEYVTTHGR